MGIDTRYSGPGKIGGAWASVLLVKHVLIVVMLGFGSYLDGLIVRLDRGADTIEPAITRVARGAIVMAILGAIVLLLTAAAQGA